MGRRIHSFGVCEAVRDLIKSTSLTTRDSVSLSVTGRKEDKRVKVKKNFVLSNGRLSVATSGSSNATYNWLSRGRSESPERLFQTTPPSLVSITSLPKTLVPSSVTTTETVLCHYHGDSLLLKGTAAGGNVPYFLGGMEQKKACDH